MSVKPLLQLDRVLNERYRIVRLLARGGFGEVYEALDLQLERRVALKYIFQPLDLNLLHNEVKILAANAERLRFMPNVYDFWRGTRGAGYYIVMEYVEGPTLNERQPLPWSSEQIIAFLRALLGNLRDLHQSRIVHCDIKPVNIKATSDQNLSIQLPYRLLDFGIARRDEHTSVVAASPHYGAPEQHGLGATLIDHRADLYALGATAYFLLTGQKPRDARERYAALARGERNNLARPSSLAANVSPGLDALLLELMQLDRERRPADADAALALLDALPVAPPTSLAPKPKRDDEPESDEPYEQNPAGQQTDYSPSFIVRPLSLKPDPAAESSALPDAPALPLAAAPDDASQQPAVAFRPATVLDRQGNGVITGLAWESTGDALLIASTLGVYRYDIGEATCTLWHATDRPVSQLGIISSGAAVLVATTGDTRALPFDGGAAVPMHLSPGANNLLTAPLGDVLAAVVGDALRLIDLKGGADDIAWSLPEQLAGRALALAADGQTIVIGVADQLSYVSPRGARRGQHQSVAGIPQPIADLALTPDGAIAAIAGGNAVAIWRLGEATAQIFDHSAAARLAITADGELFAVADDAGVSLRRARDGKSLPELSACDLHDVRFLAFCPRDRLLAAATPGELRIWRLADSSLTARLDQFGAVVGWLALRSEEQIASQGDVLRLWSVEGGQLRSGAALTIAQPGCGVAIGGASLAGGEDQEIVLRRLDDLSVQHRLPLALAQRHGLAISPDGARLLVLADGTLVIYDLQAGNEIARLPLGDGQQVEHVAIAADCTAVATHNRGQIIVQSADDGSEIGRLRPRIPGELTTIALAPDGRRLAAAIGGMLALWEIGAGRVQLAGQRRMGGAAAHYLAFAADGRAIVALQGTEARVWQLGDDQIASEPVACTHNDRVTDALLIADGRQLVTAARDGTLRLWNIA